jgi:hypothetical protein
VQQSIGAIADAVAAEITAGWPALTVARAYLHEFDETSTAFHCSVVPSGRTSEQIARNTRQVAPQLTITFSQLVANTANATIDPLVATLEAVMDSYSQDRPLAGIAGVQVLGKATSDALYVPALLDEKSLFVGSFTIDLVTFGSWGLASLAVTNPAVGSVSTPYLFTVTALDSTGKVLTGYAGTVSLTGSDSNVSVFGSPATLTAGVGVFSVQVNHAETATLTATDAAQPNATGTGTITVS